MAEGADYDVIIVGGGPAGLSAATLLARCCRRVLVCDAGNPRNVRSQGVHGFLTREGIRPLELLAIAREQIAQYGVEWRETTVMRIDRDDREPFRVSLLDGQVLRCRRVLLATGVVDTLPEIEGIDELYGVSVHHCPYCDAWEHRNESIALYGKGTEAANAALGLLTWSKDIVLCSNGAAALRGKDKARLQAHAIRVYEQKIRRLEGTAGKLSQIVFCDGSRLRCSAMFFVSKNAAIDAAASARLPAVDEGRRGHEYRPVQQHTWGFCGRRCVAGCSDRGDRGGGGGQSGDVDQQGITEGRSGALIGLQP